MEAMPDLMRLGVLLRQAHSRSAAALNAALEPLSLTGRHFGVLLHLSRVGESTHKELSTLYGSDKAGMARTIDALVEAGLVNREASTTDRRVVRLTLTDAGAAITLDALARADAVAGELFDGFTEAELTVLDRLLQRFTHPAKDSNRFPPG